MSLEDKLEEIENEYQQMLESAYTSRVEIQHTTMKLTGVTLLLSICVACLALYYQFPIYSYQQFMFSTYCILCICLLWVLRSLLTFYYHQSFKRVNKKMQKLLSEKRRLLEQVKETHTYKKAHAILERFDPDQLKGNNKNKLKSSFQEKNLDPYPKNMPSPTAYNSKSVQGVVDFPSVPMVNFSSNKVVCSNYYLFQQPRTPRPILPRQRSALDKLVEFIVGDGPNNRYALICVHCYSHNGMALKEDFETLAFRCCYCAYFNPAKQKMPEISTLGIPSITFLENEEKLPEGNVHNQNLMSNNISENFEKIIENESKEQSASSDENLNECEMHNFEDHSKIENEVNISDNESIGSEIDVSESKSHIDEVCLDKTNETIDSLKVD